MPNIPKYIKPQPIHKNHGGLKLRYKNFYKSKIWLKPIFWISVGILLLVTFIFWFIIQLSPVGGDINQLKKVTINEGSNSRQIGNELKKQSIIRNSFVFDIYTRFTGKNNTLQAGTYHLSPAENMSQIVNHLINGSVDQFSITFFPGATLTDKTNSLKKYDVTTVLKNAGYSTQEISDALNMTYQSPLFKDKPSKTTLEGYIYGQTYNFNAGVSVEDILQRTFDEFYKQIQENNLIEGFANHGLNLYQGITLASIIQRETADEADQKQVAQVFYSRLNSDMILGSDVTYQYIADKTGVPRDINLDSPYNTRRYPGLTPGPIAVPGISALKAVANPAEGDYFYFVSDSSGKTYFARTENEHQFNIVNYCKENCIAP